MNDTTKYRQNKGTRFLHFLKFSKKKILDFMYRKKTDAHITKKRLDASHI